MRKLSLSILLLLVSVASFGAGVAAIHPPQFRIGFGAQPPPRIVMGQTVAGGAPTIARDTVCVYADGHATIAMTYQTGQGQSIGRILRVPADGTAIVDSTPNANVISATVPPALTGAISAFTGQLDGMIATAATAGKLNL